MPSQSVIDALSDLTKELEAIKPALVLVKKANETVDISKGIPGKVSEFIDKLEKNHEKEYLKLKKGLDDNVKEFNDEYKRHAKELAGIESSAKIVLGKIDVLLSSLINSNTDAKIEKIIASLKLMKDDISLINGQVSNIEKVSASIKLLRDDISLIYSQLGVFNEKFRDTTNDLWKRIEKKMNLSSQEQRDSLEKYFNSFFDGITKKFKLIYESYENANRNIKIYFIIVFILQSITIISLILKG
jgi:hypothetical protein